MDYRVAKDRGCLAPNGAYYAPGQAIDVDHFGEERIEQLVAAGYLVAAGEEHAEEPQGRTGPVSPSPWSRDPATLEGKDLDELNVIILEIDDRVAPAETVEDAIYQLCKDWEG